MKFNSRTAASSAMSICLTLATAGLWMWLSSMSAYGQDPVDASAGTSGAQQTGVETFYQRVEILRTPKFSLQGMLIQQQIRYRILSTFELHPPDARGNRRVVQTIGETELLEADPLSRAAFASSLEDLRGKSFTYEVDRSIKVVSMQGHQPSQQAIELAQPRSQGFLVSTVLNEDGWKELVQLTLFQPPIGRSRQRFSRQTTHDWGELGSWYGRTDFIRREEGRGRERYSFKHLLEYRPPVPIPGGQPSALPFAISSATFRTYEAIGEILYDAKSQRVSSTREVFHAQGTIAASVLGVPTQVELDERQEFQIEVTRARTLRIPATDSTKGRP
jgi:hypothetical protein